MLNHKGTQTIITPRLRLRRFSTEDAPAMFENWASDPLVTKFLRWAPHESLETTRGILSSWCANYERVDNYNWVIEVTDSGMIVGNISVVRMSDRSEWAELGYCIGSKFWNGGITTEAARAVIGFLFGEVGFNRIVIAHAVKNPASGRVAQKCGLMYEGTSRQKFKAGDGEFHDIAQYSILREEWEK